MDSNWMNAVFCLHNVQWMCGLSSENNSLQVYDAYDCVQQFDDRVQNG